MSLKHVHLVFISLCVALLGGCAWLALQVFREDGGWGSMAAALAAVGGITGLVHYERGFLARCKQAGVR
jgi:hypothetical protein